MDTHIPDITLSHGAEVALGDYSEALKKLAKLKATVDEAKRFINQLQDGLPPHLRAATRLQSRGGIHDMPTTVYQRNANGEWDKRGAVVADGGYEQFFATSGCLVDGQIVLIDAEHGWGVTANYRVEVVNINEHPRWITQHASTIALLKRVNPDQHLTYIDCMWA